MKVGIFYFSKAWAPDRAAIYADNDTMQIIPIGWVRCEVIESANAGDALGDAAPRSDESVMNTHALGEEGE